MRFVLVIVLVKTMGWSELAHNPQFTRLALN